MSSSRNPHTLSPIFSNARSGEAAEAYQDNYDAIFNAPEILPCPCGSDAAVQRVQSTRWVECPKCGAAGMDKISATLAVKAWNAMVREAAGSQQ